MPTDEDIPANSGAAGVSERVVQEVAALLDTDPLYLEPLQHTVDADALDVLFERGFSGRVEFQYADCTVTVDGGSNEVMASGPRDDVDRSGTDVE